MKKILTICFAFALTSCTTLVDTMDKAAQVGQVSVTKSDFDGSTIIKSTPNGLFNPNGGLRPVRTMLGSVWSSKLKDSILITMQDAGSLSPTASYITFTGMSLNIDGEITHYNTDLTHYSVSSVTIPMQVFEKMLASKDCRIRVLMLSGYEDASCSHERITGGKSTAIMTYKQVLQEINARR